MTRKHGRVQIILVMISLLVLAVGLAPGEALGDHWEDPYNPDDYPVDLRLTITEMVFWCNNVQGGTGSWARYTDEFGTVYYHVICDFGLLGSWYCVIYHAEASFKTYCGATIPKTSDPLNVLPDGAVTVASQERIETLEPTTGLTKPPICPIIVYDPRCERERLAETPTLIQVMVVANPAGHSMEEMALLPVNGCRAAGGEAQVSLTGDTVTIGCVGGIGDGLWCQVDDRGTMCTLLQNRESQLPPPTEAPPPPTEAATETVPMPTVAATEVPVAPTMAPTEAPPPPTATATETVAMPTVVATEVPVAPTMTATEAPPPPIDDNSVPPSGPIEDPTDPEALPTEAPLL